MSCEISLEPTHDVRLLRLGEAGPAIVNANRENSALLREVEGQAQVVPLLDPIIVLLPFIILDKHRFLVCDQENLTVFVLQVLLLRVSYFLFCFLQ